MRIAIVTEGSTKHRNADVAAALVAASTALSARTLLPHTDAQPVQRRQLSRASRTDGVGSISPLARA